MFQGQWSCLRRGNRSGNPTPLRDKHRRLQGTTRSLQRSCSPLPYVPTEPTSSIGRHEEQEYRALSRFKRGNYPGGLPGDVVETFIICSFDFSSLIGVFQSLQYCIFTSTLPSTTSNVTEVFMTYVDQCIRGAVEERRLLLPPLMQLQYPFRMSEGCIVSSVSL